MTPSDEGPGKNTDRIIEAEAKQLVEYINSLEDFELLKALTYEHMGALLTDAVLQAGINFNTVVRPKVKRLLDTYPESDTTSRFLKTLETEEKE